MATKRKVTSKPLHKKYQALLEVEGGGKKKDIAEKYGVPLNTLSTWIKNSSKIKQTFQSGNQNLARKRVKVGKYEDVSAALLKWFTNKMDQGAAISGPLMIEKAQKFAEDMGYEDFKCSQGWLTSFKERYNIKLRSIQGEERAVNSSDVDAWHQTIWTEILQEYEAKNIYNCDESGLFYRVLPNRTLAFKGQKCSGGKMSKERISVLFCANMDGTDRVPLLCIGKSHNPRSFRGHLTLPTEYRANSKAWMTGDIFTEWIRKFDSRMSLQNRKIALLLDNCSAHPKYISGLKSVKMFFLPPNCTSILQPMDQGIIRCFKHHYRSSINKRNIDALDSGTEFKLTMLDALREAQRAWAKVTPETISNCWLHMAFREYETPREVIPPVSDQPGLPCEEFSLYTEVDDELITSEMPSDEEIVKEVKGAEEEEDSDQEEEEGPQEEPTPSQQEAERMCKQLRRFIESIENSSQELEYVTKLEIFLNKTRNESMKQSTISDFFTEIS